MKYFFTAWTLYCGKEQSGICEVVETLQVQIVDSLSNPIPNTSFKLIHQDGSETDRNTDEDGILEVTNLIPGNYQIKFTTDD